MDGVALFRLFYKMAVFANVVKQSRTDFCSEIELDCFAKLAMAGLLKQCLVQRCGC